MPLQFWRCQKCQAVYASRELVTELPSTSQARLLAPGEFTPTDFSLSNQESLTELVSMATGFSLNEAKTQTAGRYPLSLPITGTPLSDKLIPLENTFHITCRDVSTSGISFFSQFAIEAPYLLLDFAPAAMTGLQLLVHVVRERQVGVYFEYGCDI